MDLEIDDILTALRLTEGGRKERKGMDEMFTSCLGESKFFHPKF